MPTVEVTVLEATRRFRGWSRARLAEAAGVGEGTVRDIERGYRTRGPSAHRIAAYLDVPVEELSQPVYLRRRRQGRGSEAPDPVTAALATGAARIAEGAAA